jgi:hypothetical protein
MAASRFVEVTEKQILSETKINSDPPPKKKPQVRLRLGDYRGIFTETPDNHLAFGE